MICQIQSNFELISGSMKLQIYNVMVRKGVIHILCNGVRGGEGRPLHYSMMNMVSKMVYYVLLRGGGGKIMVKLVLRNL